MTARPWLRRNLSIVLGVVGTAVGGFLAYRLTATPFGTLFWASVWVALGGLVATLLLVSLRLVRARAWWKKIAGIFLALLPLSLSASTAFLTFQYQQNPAFIWRLLAPSPGQRALFTGVPKEVSVEGWRHDLQYVAREMPRRHPNLFANVSREQFHGAVDELDADLPTLSRNQVIARLMSIVALAKDGHSAIPLDQPALNLHFYPLKLFVFDDGVHVTGAGRGHGRFRGWRVARIGNARAEQVVEDLKRLIAADNEMTANARLPTYLVAAELLQALGYVDDRRRGEFVLTNEAGEEIRLRLKPISGIPFLAWFYGMPLEREISPAAYNVRRSNYWFEFLEPSRTVYVQFNAVRNQRGGETIQQFSDRLRAFLDANEVDRLVIDVRNNGGGDGTLIGPLVELLSQHEKVNRQGALFAIIGRKTFSAAVRFATALERRTKTLFVGEPTGSGPNNFGDNAPLLLPNSRIIVLISMRYWVHTIPEDARKAVYPDLPVPYTHHDFLAGRDPAMEAILGYVPRAPAEIGLQERSLERYTGRYLLNPMQILAIEKKGERLALRISDFEVVAESDLYPASETDFSTDINGAMLRFRVDPRGRVDGLHLSWGGGEAVARRLPEGYRTPVELLQSGRLEEGSQGFRAYKAQIGTLSSSFELGLQDMGLEFLRSERGRKDSGPQRRALSQLSTRPVSPRGSVSCERGARRCDPGLQAGLGARRELRSLVRAAERAWTY